MVALILLATVLDFSGAGEQNQAAWILIGIMLPSFLVRRVFDANATLGMGWLDLGILIVFYFALSLLLGKIWTIYKSRE